MVKKTAKETKKTTTKSTAKKTAKSKGKKSKADDFDSADAGIIVIEEDIQVDKKADKKAELEARKAYLEEARSQEASSD